MSDLPSKPVNEFALLHTVTRVRKVVGVAVHELGKIENAYAMRFCEFKGDVANIVFGFSKSVKENEKVVRYGTELSSSPIGHGTYIVAWTEQRKVHLPSMTVIGEPHFWDPCPSCKEVSLSARNIVKKGDLTVSLEQCYHCHPRGQELPHIRNGWGKDPKALPESVFHYISNNKNVLFYNYAPSTEEKYKFYMLKWSDLEKGNFTGMGVPVPLPKEVLTLDHSLGTFFLNRYDQLCALWHNGSLILGGKFFKIEALKEFEKGEWRSMLELKSRTNRYVLAGCYGEDPDRVGAITLIDGRAKVLSSLAIEDSGSRYIYMRLLERSTLIVAYCDSLSVVAVKRDRLTLIANEVAVFQGGNVIFISGSNNGKRLLMISYNNKTASVRLRYH